MDENSLPERETRNIGAAPKVLKKLFIVLLGLGVLVILGLMLLPAVRTAREPARRNACLNKLKQIGIALHHYAKDHGGLPPAYTTDADGKPLHSWRTLILPYLEQKPLYDTIDLTKPWDDPVNAKARETAIDEYQCPSWPRNVGDNRTMYLAVLTPNSCLRAAEPRDPAQVVDAKHTLIIIEVDDEHSVPWMAPVDADEEVVMGVGIDSRPPHIGGMCAVCVDGSVHLLPADLPVAQRRAVISIFQKNEEAFPKE